MRQKARTKIWVLTTEMNDYDQHGSYLVAWWETKPLRRELAEILGLEKNASLITHILSGGGRQDSEYQWWYLKEVEEGDNFF